MMCVCHAFDRMLDQSISTSSNIYTLSDVFPPQEEIDEYGIDWDGPLPIEETEGTVEVPHVLCPLNSLVEEEIRRQINPLRESRCYGIDIYLEACSFVSHFLKQHQQ